jgi:pentatricopeptide repeat protein
MPALAQCFVERGRYVAAMACLDEAIEAGVDPKDLGALRERVDRALGPAAKRLTERLAEDEPAAE